MARGFGWEPSSGPVIRPPSLASEHLQSSNPLLLLRAWRPSAAFGSWTNCPTKALITLSAMVTTSHESRQPAGNPGSDILYLILLRAVETVAIRLALPIVLWVGRVGTSGTQLMIKAHHFTQAGRILGHFLSSRTCLPQGLQA